MAANRTFQFRGIGYGDSPVTVTASVNSTQIFSGTIPTLPGNPPEPGNDETPTVAYDTVAFTLDNSALLNTDFSGSLPMTIEISGGNAVIFTEILSNYWYWITDSCIDVPLGMGNVNNFAQCYNGTPVNSESTPDPRSSVYINGIQQVPPQQPSKGCWCWTITSPATMTYNWNISVGQTGNIVGNSDNYTSP
jgi:hypothetical protein